MGVHIGLVTLLLALALALVAASSTTYDANTTVAATALGIAAGRGGDKGGLSACINGQIGGCLHDGEEMMMDSESSRRVLYQSRYIGYAAMMANRIPCSRRGQSYCNCRRHKRMNPYTRGCSRITRCKRIFQ